MSQPGPEHPETPDAGQPSAASAYPPPGYPSSAFPPAPGPLPPAFRPGSDFPPAPGPPAARDPWVTRPELIFGAILIAALAAVGVGAGVLWNAISPAAGGVVIGPSVVIPNENEGFIAGDGRFMIITAVIGLVAGAIAWGLRSYRGPVAALALAIGGTLGATLTALVGHALASGRTTGVLYSGVRLRLTLQAHSLIALEGGLALLAYLIGTLFIAADDLGRPAGSVGAGGDPQGLGGDGNRPGRAQDGQFAPQQGDLGREPIG